MKKYGYLLLIMIFAICGPVFAQDETVWPDKSAGTSKNLVLTHPTVHNLKTFKKILDRALISIDGYKIVGIYHENERYDYQEARNYLDTADVSEVDMFLHEFSDTIHPGVLYQENKLTDDYRKVFRHSRGVIFFGGPDLPPQAYDEKTHLLTSIYDPYRHYFELSFLFHLFGGPQNRYHKPLLSEQPGYLIYGFCLGMQTMNVAAGGTMVQDIPTEIYGIHYIEDLLDLDPDRLHRNYHRKVSIADDLLSGNFHRINIKETSPFRQLNLSNPTPMVYSNHHQAVDQPGKGFRVTATSMDGKVVEALQHRKFNNVLGVQFHPEASFLYDKNRTFRINPRDTVLFSGREMLLKSKSLSFHRKFWKDFEKRLKNQ
jgi:putative glutamine amidotransferase